MFSVSYWLVAYLSYSVSVSTFFTGQSGIAASSTLFSLSILSNVFDYSISSVLKSSSFNDFYVLSMSSSSLASVSSFDEFSPFASTLLLKICKSGIMSTSIFSAANAAPNDRANGYRIEAHPLTTTLSVSNVIMVNVFI